MTRNLHKLIQLRAKAYEMWDNAMNSQETSRSAPDGMETDGNAINSKLLGWSTRLIERSRLRHASAGRSYHRNKSLPRIPKRIHYRVSPSHLIAYWYHYSSTTSTAVFRAQVGFSRRAAVRQLHLGIHTSAAPIQNISDRVTT